MNPFAQVKLFCPDCGEEINYDTIICLKCCSDLRNADKKLSKELKRGRNLIRLILLSTLIIMFLSVLEEVLKTGPDALSRFDMALGFFVIVYIFSYFEFRFASWIIIIFLGISGVSLLIDGIQSSDKSLLFLITILVGLLFIVCAVSLTTVKSIRQYQKFQRKIRKLKRLS